MENFKDEDLSEEDVQRLLAKFGIRDVTQENLGKTYIDITPKRRDELATSDDGLIYLAVSGRLASDNFFEDTGFYEVWGNHAWENREFLGDAIYFGWGYVYGKILSDGEYGWKLTDGPSTKSFTAVEVYCVERKHIELIENYLFERSWADTPPPRVLVTVEPKEAIFSSPIQAWAFYSE